MSRVILADLYVSDAQTPEELRRAARESFASLMPGERCDVDVDPMIEDCRSVQVLVRRS